MDVSEMTTPDLTDNMSYTTDVPKPKIEGAHLAIFRFVCEVALSLPIATFGICGNILVFVVLCRQKQRLTTDVLLQALAVADTLVLVSSILLGSMRRVGWDAFDSIYHYIFLPLYPCLYFFRLVDTWLTVMMTIDRYIAVCHPLRAQHLCTLRRTYISIAVIIFVTLVISLPRFFEFEMHYSDADELYTGYMITPLLKDKTYTFVYRIALFFLVMYLIPMGVLVILNVRLLLTLRSAYRYRSSMISSGNMHTSKGQQPNENRGVTIVVVTIVIVCVICNVTAMISHVIWTLQTCIQKLSYMEVYRRFVANVSNVMVIFNCAINFIIYCLFSRKFRSGLKQTLTCNRLRIFWTRRWRAGHPAENSASTPNTSYTSMGRLPIRVTFKTTKYATSIIHADY